MSSGLVRKKLEALNNTENHGNLCKRRRRVYTKVKQIKKTGKSADKRDSPVPFAKGI